MVHVSWGIKPRSSRGPNRGRRHERLGPRAGGRRRVRPGVRQQRRRDGGRALRRRMHPGAERDIHRVGPDFGPAPRPV
jgi:hypothetical protein